jgi:hypothetical protein
MSENVESRARDLGWVPQEEYKGDPSTWRSAEDFVERGERILPIVRSHNRKLEGDVARLSAENRKLAEMFKASQESIVELQGFHEQSMKDALARQKLQLAAELQAARDAGDVHAEVDVQTRIAELGKEAPAAKPAARQEERQTPQQPQLDPAIAAWQQTNKWFGTDARKTQVAMGVANLIAAEEPDLSGQAFVDRLNQRLAERDQPGSGHQKVGGGRPSGTGGGGGGRGAGYDALPSDAKEACLRQAKKLVGEGRAFKDLGSWQKYYAEQYQKGEE